MLDCTEPTGNIFSLPPPFVVAIILPCFTFIFNSLPVEPRYQGRNVMEGEKRCTNIPHQIKYLASFLVTILQKSQGTLKQFIGEHIPTYLKFD